MSNPEPNIHNELLVHFEAVSNNAKKLGRLETLMEINNLLRTMSESTKSIIEKRTLLKVVQNLENLA